MKKIVIWESLPNISGGQRVALNIAGQLKEKFDLSFIVPAEGRLSSELERMGIDVHYIKTGFYRSGKKRVADILMFIFDTPSALLRSYRVVKDADIIYANAAKAFLWSAVMGTITKVPVIWHLHGILSDDKVRFLVELFGRFRSIKKIITVSDAVRSQFRSLASKTETVYNGVDLSKFSAGPAVKELRNDDGEERIIGIIADIIAIKGHDILIRALNIINEDVPVRLLIVGSHQGYDGSYEKSVRLLVDELGLTNKVTFTGYRTDIPDIIKSLDLVVVPSRTYEACPLAALEAFACGVPVVGSDLGGTPELIVEGKTGYVFKANDEDNLAEKILLILNHPDSYSTIRSNCRKIAEERFDLKKSAKKIESIILQNT